MIYGPYNAIVRSVHDGDTARVDVDLGFGLIINLSCRFYGINAPELNTIEGIKARDYLQKLLPPGTAVLTVSHGWDKYGGRYDGEIVKDGVNINQKMIADGYAVQL